jgi:hypothetical protein
LRKQFAFAHQPWKEIHMRRHNFSNRRGAVFLVTLALTACGGGGGYGGGGGGSSSGGSGTYTPPTQPSAPAPPTIGLEQPASAKANRTVPLTADVNAAGGVKSVEFLVDGTVVGTVNAAPFTFSWDTSTVTDGDHSVTARVTDNSSNVATSTATTYTVTNHPVIHVTLSADQIFPKPTSTATGEGDLTFDLISGAVTGGVTLSGITATLAHIHEGYAAENGGVLIDFVQDPADPNHWTPDSSEVLTADQIAFLLDGELYLNVHSAAYPGGEIRAQIIPDNIQVVFANMDGSQVVPAATTTASGLAAVTLNKDENEVSVHVSSTGADDATDAHVHVAAAGSNASDTLITLEKDPAKAGHWSAEDQPITSANHDAFDANNWYVDVHTPGAPDGAIRGQFVPNPAPPPPPPPAAPKLSDLQTEIFTPMCSGCHSGGGASLPSSMDLSSASATFAAWVNVASVQQSSVLRVKPNDADNSYVIRKLEGAPGITGQRMPRGGPFLDQATIDKVKAWINAGAQNN